MKGDSLPSHDMADSPTCSSPGHSSWGTKFFSRATLSSNSEPSSVTLCRTRPPRKSSPKSDHKNPSPISTQPIDIFGNSFPSGLAPKQDTGGVVRKRITKESVNEALRNPEIRRSVESRVASTEFTRKLAGLDILPVRILSDRATSGLGILPARTLPDRTLSRRTRRLLAKTDHPLECDTPLQIETPYTERPRLEDQARCQWATRRDVDRPDNCPESDKPLRFRATRATTDAGQTDFESKRLTSRTSRFETPSNATQTIPDSGPCSILCVRTPKVQPKETTRVMRPDSAIVKLSSEKLAITPDAEIGKQPHNTETIALTDGGTREQQNPRLVAIRYFISLAKEEQDNFMSLLSQIYKPVDITATKKAAKKHLNPRASEFYGSDSSSNCSEQMVDSQGSWAPVYVPSNLLHPSQPVRWQHALPQTDLLSSQVVAPNYQIPQGLAPILMPCADISQPTTQDHSGREVKVINSNLSQSLLNRFTVKYPLTGSLRAAAPVESQKRLATTIQQRLEYLLMQQREKKGMMLLEEEKENVGPTNLW